MRFFDNVSMLLHREGWLPNCDGCSAHTGMWCVQWFFFCQCVSEKSSKSFQKLYQLTSPSNNHTEYRRALAGSISKKDNYIPYFGRCGLVGVVPCRYSYTCVLFFVSVYVWGVCVVEVHWFGVLCVCVINADISDPLLCRSVHERSDILQRGESEAPQQWFDQLLQTQGAGIKGVCVCVCVGGEGWSGWEESGWKCQGWGGRGQGWEGSVMLSWSIWKSLILNVIYLFTLAIEVW